MRWLRTHGYNPPSLRFEIVSDDWLFDGWLIGLQTLSSNRVPGNTCLSALSDAKKMGRPAVNNTKGCGGAMRVTQLACQ